VVASLYGSLLGRYPSGGEEKAHIDRLLAGGSVEQLVESILTSSEWQGHFFRSRAFDELLAPDPLPLEVPRLYFCHLPKTGGSSLREMLRPHFDELEFCGGFTVSEFYRLSPYRLRSYRVITGHFGPNLCLFLPEVRVVTATLVREPVAMVVSHYVHWRDHGVPADPFTQLARRLSFDSWCRCDDTVGLWSNPQAADLCLPRIPPTRAEALIRPEGARVAASAAELREQAGIALEQMDIVGTTDDLLAVYRACLHHLGKAPSYTQPLRENVGGLPEVTVSPSTRDWLLERNTIDQELFERAQLRGTELQVPPSSARQSSGQ
jgi:hypothetical protein